MDAEIKERDQHVESKRLDKLAKQVIVYLLIGSLISFVLGFFLIEMQDRFKQFLAIALIGFSGSAIAALTSCLDRYVTGFELEDGTKRPKEARGETFNSRMSLWFIVRPFLGFVIAPVLIWGLGFFVKDSEQYRNSTESLAFTAFLGGLLAKSVIELIKGLFKNIFKG
jgi:hypothetical protein